MKVLIQNTKIAAAGILSVLILAWMTSTAFAHHGGVSAAFGHGTPVVYDQSAMAENSIYYRRA